MKPSTKENIAIAIAAVAFVVMLGVSHDSLAITAIIKLAAGGIFYLCSLQIKDENEKKADNTTL